MTKKEIKDQWHIVNGHITNMGKIFHPLGNKQFNKGNRDIDEIEQLLKLIPNSQIISRNSNGWFVINFYNKFTYNVWINFLGEKAPKKSDPRRKAVSIRANSKCRKQISNFKNVIIIALYYYLLERKKGKYEIDKKNKFYCFIDPLKQIKSLAKVTSSNQWVTLNEIQSCEIPKQDPPFAYKTKKTGVYVCHPKNISKFFTKKWFRENEENLIKAKETKQYEDYLQEKVILESKEKKFNDISIIFRKGLLEKEGYQCQWNKCSVIGKEFSEILIASHIRAQRFIKNDNSLNDEQKRKELTDFNNGFLFCKMHDAMFDAHLLTFNKYGKIKQTKGPIKKIIEALYNYDFKNQRESDPVVEFSKKTEDYLKKHREETKNKLSKLKKLQIL